MIRCSFYWRVRWCCICSFCSIYFCSVILHSYCFYIPTKIQCSLRSPNIRFVLEKDCILVVLIHYCCSTDTILGVVLPHLHSYILPLQFHFYVTRCSCSFLPEFLHDPLPLPEFLHSLFILPPTLLILFVYHICCSTHLIPFGDYIPTPFPVLVTFCSYIPTFWSFTGVVFVLICSPIPFLITDFVLLPAVEEYFDGYSTICWRCYDHSIRYHLLPVFHHSVFVLTF